MKKKSMKLTVFILTAALVLTPQTALAKKKDKTDKENNNPVYEAIAPAYQYDDNATADKPSETSSRFIKEDGIYVNPQAEATNKATLMITGDLMCQKGQQEAAFESDGSDYITTEEFKVIKQEAEERLEAAMEEMLKQDASLATEQSETGIGAAVAAPGSETAGSETASSDVTETDGTGSAAAASSVSNENTAEAASTEEDYGSLGAASSIALPQLDYGVIPQPEGKWDFDESFQYVRKILRKGDLVIGNLETMLSQSSPLTMQVRRLEDKPYLNTPEEYLGALDYAGYDMLTLANNHNCDVGVRGLLETLENIDNYGFMRTGMFADEEEERYIIVDVNGIKIGFVAYATYFNQKDDNFTGDGQDVLLNRYYTDNARRDIKAARKAGAEYVIAFMHWGAENTHEVTYNQQRYARSVANAGADYIVGSHPHALQHYEIIQTDDEREVPVIYSMGNFLSSMSADVNNDTLVLQLNLEKNDEGEVSVASHRIYPCTILEDLQVTGSNGKTRTDSYVVTPHSDTYGPKLSEKDSASRADIQYMKTSLTRIMNVFGNRTVFDLPYDPYHLNISDDEHSISPVALRNRLDWVLANVSG